MNTSKHLKWIAALALVAGILTAPSRMTAAEPEKPAPEAADEGACGCDEDEPETEAKPAEKPVLHVDSKPPVTISHATAVSVSVNAKDGKALSSVKETSRARYENGVLVEKTETRVER